jgi:hypothetical protein
VIGRREGTGEHVVLSPRLSCALIISLRAASGPGLDVLGVLQQAGMAWLPAECLQVRVLDEGWSVAKIGAERAEGRLRYRFNREP